MIGLTGFVSDASRLRRLTLRVYQPGGESISIPLPPGDEGTRATLEAMAAIARSAARHGAINYEASRVGSAPAALFHALQRIRFQRDPAWIEDLKHPVETLASLAGDCDDRATLGAALALAQRSGARFVAIGTDPHGPYQHVYIEILDPSRKEWTAIDPQETDRVGMTVPHTRRMEVMV